MNRGMVNLPGIVGLGMILMVGVGCAEETEPVNGAGGLLPEGEESVTTIGDLVINEVVALLSGYGSPLVSIVGHTDTVGSVAYNQRLSERRATAAPRPRSSPPATS